MARIGSSDVTGDVKHHAGAHTRRACRESAAGKRHPFMCTTKTHMRIFVHEHAYVRELVHEHTRTSDAHMLRHAFAPRHRAPSKL